MSTDSSRAVRFDRYGDRDVLYVADIPRPHPGAGEVLVAVRAAGINPGESAIRSGALAEQFPATFPSGEGSDLAGSVVELGDGVAEFALGDAVLGWSWQRSSHATHVTVPVTQLIAKPEKLSWEAAGALYVAGCTAWAAVDAIDPQAGQTVVVAGASGGVGTIVVQLLSLRGVQILGIASPANADWLSDHGATPVAYGPDLTARIVATAPQGIDGFIDLFGPEYVQLAIDLGIAPAQIETIISFAKAQEFGTKSAGSADGSSREVLSEMAGLVASGQVEIPIAATYPLDDVAAAFAELEQHHTRGKIVLIP
jgi:NADPH:quinone reductase